MQQLIFGRGGISHSYIFDMGVDNVNLWGMKSPSYAPDTHEQPPTPSDSDRNREIQILHAPYINTILLWPVSDDDAP